MRFETSLPQVTSSTAASFAFLMPTAIASVSSPFVGTMSKEAGSGFDARFEVSSGARFFMIASACSFVMKETDFTRGSDSRKLRS